ncbi:hypothetical protein [Celeribacter sp. ULVN23_4]
MLVPSGPTDHLFIVCNDTCNLGANLLINISSVVDLCDKTCVLNVGDHPFIQHPSFVFYARAIIHKAENLQRGFDNGMIKPQDDLAEEVFARVVEGITVSPDTPQNVVRYYTQL